MNETAIKNIIKQIAELKTDLYNKDFLLTWRQSTDELKAILLAAESLQAMYENNISTNVFSNGLGVANFRDMSTRTRFSFASACSLMGLSFMDFDEGKSQMSHGETVRETANMISFATEVIGIRDDLFVGFGHEYMKEVSDAIEDGYREKILPQRPSIINLQCDRDHPTQSMADLQHLKETFGGFENLRGKKIAMTWAYSPSYGKPLSVPQAIIALMSRFGMNVVLAHPEGYGLQQECLDAATKFAKESGGTFTQVQDMDEAFADADIVYPKSWGSLGLMTRRTDLLKSGQGDRVQELEAEGLAENARHKDWECDERRMALTKKALYMHCLPADISGVSCEEGEVASSVFDRYRVPTYKEARHKPSVIAAMMLMTRFENPAKVLTDLLERKQPRRMG